MSFLYACFRLQAIKQWIDSTTTSTLPDLSSSTSQIYFCNVAISRRQNWKKKTHPPNDRFLIKIQLKNALFGSSERLPPLSGVPPQIKGRPPQLVNPSQPRWVFYMRASDCNQFSNELVQQLYQHCLIFPHPPRKYNTLLQCASFKTPKLEKKTHPPNDRFLIKTQLKNAVSGSSERLPPLSGVTTTNKRTPPPISKPQPAAMTFLYACFRLQSIKQWISSTTISTLPDLSSSTSQICFSNVALFTTATTTAANTNYC